ncbi:MAG: amidase [Bryobacteraceae bacterium]
MPKSVLTKGLLRRFLDGEATLAMVEDCYRQREPEIQAFCEWAPQPSTGTGLLAGVPVAVKDIFDVAGMRTEWGSKIFAGRTASGDAGVVRMFRERGAVMLGKTHTTSFAYFDAAPTRNPRDLAHSPGGSSSGSAAAVAVGMAPVAIGSQTQGSVLRPASYCGVVGLKPSFGILPLDGTMAFAPSLDTAGLFTQTAEDMRLLWSRLGFATGGSSRIRMAALPIPEEVEGPMRAAFWQAREALDAHWVHPPDSLADLHLTVKLIQDYEGARTHQETFEKHGEAVGAKLAEMIRRGLATPDAQYHAAKEKLVSAKGDMARLLVNYDVLLTPAALGPPPRDLTYTGDPRMNAPWTGLGLPAISIPMHVEEGLPLGLQMVAGPRGEALLLDAACQAEACILEG